MSTSSSMSTGMADSASSGFGLTLPGLDSLGQSNTGIIDHARLSREGSYNAGSVMAAGTADSASSGFGLSASTIKSPGLTLPGLDPAANSRDLAADILATAILNANNQSQDSSSATGSTGVSNSQLTVNQQNFNQQVRITTVEQQQSQTTTVDLATAQSRRTFAANDDIVVSAISQSQDSNNSDPTNTVSPTSLTNLTQNKTTSTATTASEVAAQGSVVNKNVTDNSAAGTGVDINSIAVIPPGFNSYSTVIPDQQFYAQREVYKNQRVVDNTKAARFLNAASEWLHEQMVDQQYNIGRGYNLER
jgi:hypothetical protein